MKRLLCILLLSVGCSAQILSVVLAGGASAGGASPSLVNSANSGALQSGSSLNIASQNVNTGSLLVCSIRFTGNTITVTGISDTGSANTFHSGQHLVFGTDVLDVWYAYNTISQSGDSITVALSGSVTSGAVACDQFSLSLASDPKDQVAVAPGTSSNPVVSNAFTTGQANEILYAALDANSISGTWTPGACGTGTCALASSGISGTQNALNTEYLVVSSFQISQTMQATSSDGSVWAINVVTFKY